MITKDFVTYIFYKEYTIEVRPHRDGFLWAIASELIFGTSPSLLEAKNTAIDYLEENAD